MAHTNLHSLLRRRLALPTALLLALAGAGTSARAASGLTLVGHGVGMAQYGAEGYALHGSTYDAILGHYYPGTHVAAGPAGSSIRVLLQSAKPAVRVRAPGGLTAVDEGTHGPPIAVPAGSTVT